MGVFGYPTHVLFNGYLGHRNLHIGSCEQRKYMKNSFSLPSIINSKTDDIEVARNNCQWYKNC